ncbi:hypothetical protein [Azospirillum sp. sgz302134]
MRVAVLALVSLSVSFAAPLAAEEMPVPKVDYAAQVRIDGMEGPALYRHKNGVMRVDMAMDGEKVAFLFDARKGTGVMLMEEEKTAMEVGAGGGPVRLPKSGALTARKTGQDRVAGHACEVWSYTDPVSKGTDSSCITADGIVLRVTSGEGKAAKTVLEVTRLEVAPQDAALFRVPSGYEKVSMPGMPKR